MTAVLEPGLDELGEEREPDVADALAGIGRPGPWISLGRCQTVPLAVFFPERGDDADQAKKVCRLCPVQEECKSYAIDAGPSLKGIWGGTSEHERQLERRRRLVPIAAPVDVEPRPSQSPAGSLQAILVQLQGSPGRWARVARYRSSNSASAMASRLRTGRLAKPEGLWSFEGRVDDETGGSSNLYARYDGPER